MRAAMDASIDSAVASEESGAWPNALPISSLGTSHG